MMEYFAPTPRRSATLPISRSRKRLRLLAVTRIWLHAPHLAAADQIRMPPWEAARAGDFTSALFGSPAPMGENMTPPIHPATMSPLLLWALRYVERFAQDIIRAKEIRDAMVAQVRDHSRPGEQEVWEQFLDGLRENDGSVPGWLLTGNRPAIAAQYLAAKLDVGRNTIWDHRPDDIPIASAPRSTSRSRDGSMAIPGWTRSTSTSRRVDQASQPQRALW